MNVHNPIHLVSHQLSSTHRAWRMLAATLLSVIALAGGIGGSLSKVGSAYADTTITTPTCGTVTAYTAATATAPGSLSLMVGSATSAATSPIALGAAWAGLPIVVGDSACISSTLDATGALTGGTVSGAIITPSSGLFTTGPYIFARAKLVDAAGNYAGTATLAQDTASGLVYVGVTVFDPILTAGLHGIDIHSAASCDGQTFASAGDIFNPLNKQHGLANPNGPQAGDLPNISVNSNGSGDLEAVSNLFTLSAGTTSILTTTGTSLVVHAGTDDQMTDPTGNSGGGVLCGVIQAG